MVTVKGNVMEYFKPGEQMRMMHYSVMTELLLIPNIIWASEPVIGRS